MALIADSFLGSGNTAYELNAHHCDLDHAEQCLVSPAQQGGGSLLRCPVAAM
jgi:hypothetical protein